MIVVLVISHMYMAPQQTVKYCLYARKSTEQDEKQALSIDSQIKEMQQIANRDGLQVVEIKRESHSAKETGQRPVFNEMIAGIRAGTYNGILTWAPDRISRNAGDLGMVVDLLDQKRLIEIRTFSQKFTNNPNEKFMLMILGSQAKLENDQKSLNVKRGLRARCEMGLWPAPAPTGYLNNPNRDRKCEPIIDPKRAPVIKQIFEKVACEQWSGKQLYRWLRNEKKFKTVNGKFLSLSNVYIILENHFYYGKFEYPKNSDNWYQGRHEPLISQELFESVRAIIKERYIPKTESKEFAFTKLMKCGYCGSGITADEKFKALKDGGSNRHVYYLCTKSRDKNCKNPYVNETVLIDELKKLIDVIKLDETDVRQRIEAELKRYNKFRIGVLGAKQEKQNVSDTDIRNYMKYLLSEGTIYEKRELLVGIREQVVMKDRKLHIG